MSTTIVIGGANFSNPAYGDTGWAQGSASLPAIIAALAAQTASTPSFMQFVLVTVSPQSVLSGKTYLVDTSGGAITLNLPAAAQNAWFMVKDKKGTSVANNITLHRSASELIDGVAADATLAAPYGGWIFFSDGTDWYSMAYV